jgi:hypothetical protein
MSRLCNLNEITHHINLNEYFCEGCGAYLQEEDWPFLYRAVGRLCNSCKSKADILLKQGSRKCLKI